MVAVLLGVRSYGSWLGGMVVAGRNKPIALQSPSVFEGFPARQILRFYSATALSCQQVNHPVLKGLGQSQVPTDTHWISNGALEHGQGDNKTADMKYTTNPAPKYLLTVQVKRRFEEVFSSA